MTVRSPREELIQIQKKIFRKNQRVIAESILISQNDFAAYERNYLRHVKSYEEVASAAEFKKSLGRAQWIYMGDYHTNRQSQRAFLRTLKLLITQTDQFVICLEFIREEHQSYVDRYLEGQLSRSTFLKKINLKKNFHFDLWENFEPIFDFARHYQLEIFGIESAPFGAGLSRRDEAMAEALAQIHAANPGYKIFTFVGDLHIAPENLPAQTRKIIGETYEVDKELFIYQNSEKIYFKLAQQGLEDKTEVVRIDPKSYCLINTPPIVWQQSYLNWLENDEGEIDYQDAKHSFLELTKNIAKFLGFRLPKSKEEVEVFTCGDLSFLARLKDDAEFSDEEKKTIWRQVELSESYYIAKRKWVYLANVSLNHAAEEASHFLRHLLIGDEFSKNPLDHFYASVLREAIGFFGSKIINQKRKCLRLDHFKGMIDYFRKVRIPRERAFELEIAHAVVEVKKLETKGQPIADPVAVYRHQDLFFGLSHALGYMLGEILYHALILGKFSKAEARSLYTNRFEKPGEPFENYMRLLERFKQLPLPQRL